MDECYDAILMIADHAAGDGTRTLVQQRCAETMLDLLLQEDQLTDLIQRAASRNTRTDLRAVQILVQLGARAVPALIATLAADRDPTRVSRIESLVLALDDRATPALRSAMFEGKPSHRRLAVQLAAKVRDPSLVPRADGSARLRVCRAATTCSRGLDRNRRAKLHQRSGEGPREPDRAPSGAGGRLPGGDWRPARAHGPARESGLSVQTKARGTRAGAHPRAGSAPG